MTCIFCQIVRHERHAQIVYQDDLVTAFRDAIPRAPVHVLVVPNEHLATLNDITANHEGLMGRLMRVVRDVAAKEGVGERGYRVLCRVGPEGGQEVYHVHFHMMGGGRFQ